MSTRWASVIVPCRNEAGHIDTFLDSVFGQHLPPHYRLQVTIADGMSDDGTRARLASWKSRQSELVVVDNPVGFTAAGLNRAIECSSGEVVVRMDVHTTYAEDYVMKCIEALELTGATCVGGPWRPDGAGGLQRAIALAFASRLGSGGALSRRLDYSGPVDTVYLGAWKRDDLVRLGGFDESLARNQDDELCLRIWRSDGQVWQSSAIRSVYIPRASLSHLFRQFYQYGYWKVPVIRKHGLSASPRHLVPFLFVLTLLFLLVLAPMVEWSGVLGLVIIVVYLITLLVSACWVGNAREVAAIAAAIATMHLGYGIGFGHGMFDSLLRRGMVRDSMSRLTR